MRPPLALPLATERDGETGDRAAHAIARALDALIPVRLGELDAATLFDRMETKFLVPVGLVPALIHACRDEYRALTIDGRRMFRYQTRYFDTPDLTLYRAHEMGHFPRYKVRTRRYVDSGTTFLELKRKANTGRTTKTRVPLVPADAAALGLLMHPAFAGAPTVVRSGELRETLRVEYTRVSLTHGDGNERVTIDSALSFHAVTGEATYAGLAIVEVKQPRHAHSPALAFIRGVRWRPATLSKYCVGVLALFPSAPRHRFKHVLREIDRCLSQPAADARTA